MLLVTLPDLCERVIVSETRGDEKRVEASARGHLFVTVVVSGLVAAAVAFVVSLAIVPFVVGARGKSLTATTIAEGSADVPLSEARTGEVVVHYPHPFIRPPTLTFPEGLQDCFLVEQKADSFKLGRDVAGELTWATVTRVKWKAEGVPSE